MLEQGSSQIKQNKFISKETTKTRLMCRLCGEEALCGNSDEGCDNYEWFCLSQNFPSFGTTLADVINDFIPKSILSSLPAEKAPRFLCIRCFQSLHSLVKLYERIREGQKKLREKLNIVAKRRGRPKKELSQTKKTDEQNTHLPLLDINVTKDSVRSSRRKNIRNSDEAYNTRKRIKDENVSSSANSERLNVKEKTNEINLDDGDNQKDEGDDDDLTITNSKLAHAKFLKATSKRRKQGRPRVKRPKEYKCDSCGKLYNNYSSLVYHKLVSHQKTRSFKCNVCQKAFRHQSLLTNHMFTHSLAEDSFTCKKCNSDFKTRNKLAFHVNTVHSGALNHRPFICDKCGLAFKSIFSLRNHIRTHSDDNPFKCSYCGKQCCRKGNLDQHLLVHTKEMAYKCDIPNCSKRFASASQLKIHKSCHQNFKPLLCSSCGKAFNNNSNLRYHMKLHVGVKSYECSICDKRFIDKAALTRHTRIHTGEKPYSCLLCKKSFSERSNLMRHRKIHERSSSGASHSSCYTISRCFQPSTEPDKPESGNSSSVVVVADEVRNNNTHESSQQTTVIANEQTKVPTTNDTLVHIITPVTTLELMSS